MKSKDLAPILIKAGRLREVPPAYGSRNIRYELLYDLDTPDQINTGVTETSWSEALDIWVSLEPEDLPKHIAMHPVLSTSQAGWTDSLLEDDLVTYAAQAYLAGISPI